MTARVVVVALAVALAGCPGGGARPPVAGAGNTATPPAIVPGTRADLKGDVVELDIVGLDAARTETARASLASAVGSTYDAAKVAADVRALYQLGGVSDVRVDGRVLGKGVGLRYTLTPQPRVAAITVDGSNSLGGDELEAALSGAGLGLGKPLDPADNAAARLALIDTYKAQGFARVEITTTVTHRTDGEAVVFTVVEGPPVLVSAIEFTGNKAVNRKVLLSLLAKGGGITVGGRYWDALLERGVLETSAHYYDLGYVTVNVKSPTVTPAADGASVVIGVAIEEGDQYRIATTAFKGALVGPDKDYAKLLGVKAGDVFNRSKVAAGLDKIRQLHRDKGQTGVDVLPLTELDPAKKRVKLTIEITSAPAPAP